MIRNIRLVLAGLAVIAASFLFATPSRAADYTGDCAHAPTNISGNAYITDNTCVLTHNVTATGFLTLNASSISAKVLKSGTNQPLTVWAFGGMPGIGTFTGLTSGGDLSTIGVSITVNGNVSAAGNVSLQAGTLDVTGTVKSTGGGSIYLGANQITSGNISTTNNLVTVAGQPVGNIAAINVGSITTTNGAISVSVPSCGTSCTNSSIQTGALSTSNANISVTDFAAITTGAVATSGGYIEVSGAGTITTDTVATSGGFIELSGARIIASAITTSGTSSANIQLLSQSTIETGAITAAPGSVVDIEAQTSGGSYSLAVGTTEYNGVGKITATGSGDDPLLPSAIVYVSNPAGINLTATTSISVAGATGSKAGEVILNAGSGTISIPAGTMSASSTAGAGQINLLGNTVNFSGAVTLNASQTASVAATNHQINIAASNISYGTSLTLNADGNGTASGLGQVSLLPQGGITVTDNNSDPANIQISTAAASTPTGAVAISQTGTGALSIHANGNFTQAEILANPITVSGNAFMIQSQGANNHGVTINNPVLTGATGLTFSSTGTVTIDASASSTWGTNPSGGTIDLGLNTTPGAGLDPAVLNAPAFVINASATSGTAPGGTIIINSANLQLGASSTATITANAFGTGAGGNGGNISLVSNGTTPISLGTGNGQFSLSATATGTAGNGGHLLVTTPSSSPVTFPHALSLSANGIGTGLGGKIEVDSAVAAGGAANLDVNELFSVSAGSGAASGAFDGSIAINGVTCQQYQYTGNPWPTAYWDCTGQNPTLIPTVPQTAASLFPTSPVVNTLNSGNVQLYAMNSISDWNKFFATNPPNTSQTDLGETLYDAANSYIASAVFVNQGNGSANPFPASAAVNKLGSAFDDASGVLSSQSAFSTAVASDFSASGLMNTTPCTTVFSFNTALCTQYAGQSNTYIFDQLYVGGANPSNATLFAALFENLEFNGNTTPGFEPILSTYLPNSLAAIKTNLGITLFQCSPVVTIGSYPQGLYTQNCGGTSLDGSVMENTVVAAYGYTLSELRRAGVKYYLFPDPNAYHAYAVANHLPYVSPGFNDFGVTYVNSQGMPVYSAIFEQNLAGWSHINAGSLIQYTTSLQMANGLDYLMGYIAVGGIQGPISTRFSASATWKAFVDADWAYFKAQTACASSSGNGIFSLKADSSSTDNPPNYNYICNGTQGSGTALASGYTGLGNDGVLAKAWPGVYTNPQQTTVNYANIFQLAYAQVAGFKDEVGTSPRWSQVYMSPTPLATNNFACSRNLMGYVTNAVGTNYGTLPASVPTGCSVPQMPQITYCQKVWLNTGYFPDGNVFNCVLTGTAEQTQLAAQVQQKIQYMGGDTTNTPIKQSLNAAQANVYFFPNPDAITTAFMQANLPSYPSGYAPFLTANATTYPIAQMWYSFVWESSQLGTSVTPQTNVTMHELGHTVDYFYGQPSQVNLTGYTLFDAAMQNDFAAMDYVQPYGSSQAASTPLSPCDAVKGPLLGVIDIRTGNNFCNASGGGFVSGDPYAAKNPATSAPWLTSDILRSLTNPDIFFHVNNYGTFGFDTGYPATTGWDEWFAQAFAVEADPDVLGLANTGYRFDLDQIVRNGYFACTAGKPSGTTGWVHSVYVSGGSVASSPSLPSGCGLNSLPMWWPGNLGSLGGIH